MRPMRSILFCLAILPIAGCAPRRPLPEAAESGKAAAVEVRVLHGTGPGAHVLVAFAEASRPMTHGPADQLARLDLLRGRLTILEGADAAALAAYRDTLAEEPDWIIEVLAPPPAPKKADGEDEAEPAADAPALRVRATDTDAAMRLARFAVAESYPEGNAPIVADALDERIAGTNYIAIQCGAAVRPSRQARWQRNLAYQLMDDLYMPHAEPIPTHILAAGGRAYAMYDCEGVGGSGPERLERVFNETAMNCTVTRVCPEDIREGVLGHFRGVLFPGGSGKSIATALGTEGQEEVRRFVGAGGGYVGVCAGAYLASCRIDGYLRMVGALHYQPWQTGGGMLDVELTPEGEALLGREFARFSTRYNNGPLFFLENEEMRPAGDFEPITVLARFASPVEKGGTKQEHMVGSPAIVSSAYGEGRVLLVSPHPETHTELNALLARGLLWSAGLEAEGLTVRGQ